MRVLAQGMIDFGLCQGSHAPHQRVDAGLAQRRSDEAAIVGVAAAGHARQAGTEPPCRRVAWSTREQAHAAPGGRIGQKLAMKRGAGGEHEVVVRDRGPRDHGDRRSRVEVEAHGV